ncbi:UDP-N-acetylglucosamine 1-carboxyvinyltransferase (EC [uncultured Gammaproteobacteria bacterium]|nr:UDP-N-acetylglucosamine 1-carboxyvinyltransferase (EC [uncultured Gammaproteobacteria bacterium]
MAATLAKGTSIINNAAQEPEVSDLCYFLNKMGAKISGIGTSIITVEGVSKLNSIEYSVCSDRIEVGTYLIAAAITGGSITVKNANPQTMRSVLGKLIEIGADIKTEKESISLNMKGKRTKSRQY